MLRAERKYPNKSKKRGTEELGDSTKKISRSRWGALWFLFIDRGGESDITRPRSMSLGLHQKHYARISLDQSVEIAS